MSIKDFRDLICWQKCHTLVLKVYTISKEFPQDERFGLTNQLRRAVVSITSNIAEGFSRGTAKDKRQFYTIAKGSLSEVLNHLIIGNDLRYLPRQEFVILEGEIDECSRLIAGLIKSSVDRD
jgi:four helix bundle protein